MKKYKKKKYVISMLTAALVAGQILSGEVRAVSAAGAGKVVEVLPVSANEPSDIKHEAGWTDEWNEEEKKEPVWDKDSVSSNDNSEELPERTGSGEKTLLEDNVATAGMGFLVGYFVQRSKIVKLEISSESYVGRIPEGAFSCEVAQNYSDAIMAWAVKSDEFEGMYEVTIAKKDGGKIKANTNSKNLFSYLINLRELKGIENLDVSDVTDMSRMFYKCGSESMKELDLGDKFDTSNVTDMSLMFCECGFKSMEKLDLGDKFDTSNVTDMTWMFKGCGRESMKELDLGDKFDTSNVTKMYKMFNECGRGSIEKLDLGDKFDTSNVTDMRWMFAECGYEKMKELNLGEKFDASSIQNADYMFYECGYMAMGELSLGDHFTMTNCKSTVGMFERCGYESMVSLNLGSAFATPNVTNMQNMFWDCGYSSMKELDLGDSFYTSQVTNMERMFESCGNRAMERLNLGEHFDTSNVTNMASMFAFCGVRKLVSLDLGNYFDTSNVTDMYRMFYMCGNRRMKELDLGEKFDTSAAKNMRQMFGVYKSLEKINLGDKFTLANAENIREFLTYVTHIKKIYLGMNFSKINEIALNDLEKFKKEEWTIWHIFDLDKAAKDYTIYVADETVKSLILEKAPGFQGKIEIITEIVPGRLFKDMTILGNGLEYTFEHDFSQEQGKVYFSMEIPLSENNYNTAGSTKKPVFTQNGKYQIYYYVEAALGYYAKEPSGSFVVEFKTVPEKVPENDWKGPDDTAAVGTNNVSGGNVGRVLEKGEVFSEGNYRYQVTDSRADGEGTVMLLGFAKGKSSTAVKVPKTVKAGKITYKVTAVGNKAFYKNNKIKTVTAGGYVTRIGKQAFMGCKNMKTAVIGSKVTTVSDYAFSKCGKLSKVTIGKGIKKIGRHAFSYNKKLKTVTIRSRKLKSIGKKAFYKSGKVKVKVHATKKKSYKKLLKKSGGFQGVL